MKRSEVLMGGWINLGHIVSAGSQTQRCCMMPFVGDLQNEIYRIGTAIGTGGSWVVARSY